MTLFQHILRNDFLAALAQAHDPREKLSCLAQDAQIYRSENQNPSVLRGASMSWTKQAQALKQHEEERVQALVL